MWGWSAQRNRLFDPSLYKDFMSYCEPEWTSDYSYAALFDRIVAIHSP